MRAQPQQVDHYAFRSSHSGGLPGTVLDYTPASVPIGPLEYPLPRLLPRYPCLSPQSKFILRRPALSPSSTLNCSHLRPMLHTDRKCSPSWDIRRLRLLRNNLTLTRTRKNSLGSAELEVVLESLEDYNLRCKVRLPGRCVEHRMSDDTASRRQPSYAEEVEDDTGGLIPACLDHCLAGRNSPAVLLLRGLPACYCGSGGSTYNEANEYQTAGCYTPPGSYTQPEITGLTPASTEDIPLIHRLNLERLNLERPNLERLNPEWTEPRMD